MLNTLVLFFAIPCEGKSPKIAAGVEKVEKYPNFSPKITQKPQDGRPKEESGRDRESFQQIEAGAAKPRHETIRTSNGSQRTQVIT